MKHLAKIIEAAIQAGWDNKGKFTVEDMGNHKPPFENEMNLKITVTPELYTFDSDTFKLLFGIFGDKWTFRVEALDRGVMKVCIEKHKNSRLENRERLFRKNIKKIFLEESL